MTARPLVRIALTFLVFLLVIVPVAADQAGRSTASNGTAGDAPRGDGDATPSPDPSVSSTPPEPPPTIPKSSISLRSTPTTPVPVPMRDRPVTPSTTRADGALKTPTALPSVSHPTVAGAGIVSSGNGSMPGGIGSASRGPLVPTGSLEDAAGLPSTTAPGAEGPKVVTPPAPGPGDHRSQFDSPSGVGNGSAGEGSTKGGDIGKADERTTPPFAPLSTPAVPTRSASEAGERTVMGTSTICPTTASNLNEPAERDAGSGVHVTVKESPSYGEHGNAGNAGRSHGDGPGVIPSVRATTTSSPEIFGSNPAGVARVICTSTPGGLRPRTDSGVVHQANISADNRSPMISPAPYETNPARQETKASVRREGTRCGPGREGMGDNHGPHNAGKGRGPSAPPAAAPVRTGLEPTDLGKGEGGRGRRGPLDCLDETATGANILDPLLFFRFLFFLGYRRIRPGNLLDHPVRRDLARSIAAEPGLDLADCVKSTGVNRETLRYHLALLVCGGKILEEERNGSVRYFPHDPLLTPARRTVIHLDRNPSLAPVLRHIRERPGIPRRDLASLLGIAGPSITRQVQRLVDLGLVENRGAGRMQGYWLSPACAEAFAWITIQERGRNRAAAAEERAEEAYPVS